MLFLQKQGWILSQNNPRYGNSIMDPLTENAVKDKLITLESATADGWTGAFMHAWKPQYIEQNYPFWKKRKFKAKADGTGELAWETWEPAHQYGFFALLAAELGDSDVRDRLLKTAEQKYTGIWDEGTYHYQYSTSITSPCTNLTDRTLAMARAVPKNGLWTMHNVPFDDRHFTEPEISGVDLATLPLKRAIYDRAKDALVVSTMALKTPGDTSFEVKKLNPARSYRLLVDGVEVKKISGVSGATVSVNTAAPHDFVIQGE
jgi:hypothetical protein